MGRLIDLYLPILTAFTFATWLVIESPALVGLMLAVGLAYAWCRWLDNHPDGRSSSRSGP